MNRQILAQQGKKKEVAHHEAAHLVQYVLGCSLFIEYPYVERVSVIAEDSDNIAYVRHRPLAVPQIADAIIQGGPQDAAEFHRRKVRAAIVQALAGPASDFIMNPQGLTASHFFEQIVWDGSGDVDRAAELYKVIYPEFEAADYDERADSLTPLFLETIEEVRRNWQHVQTVAARLEETGILEGDDLQNIVDSLYNIFANGNL